jgi:magnesium-transporting ATPase (P-type)
MIQTAHVGIGIAGKEGRQAVLASDVAIPQFAMLERLLLVHGYRFYKRICRLILYSFCKNIAMVLPNFWFAFASKFSGQLLYFDYLLTLYNAMFTAIPILLLATIDVDLSDDLLLSKRGHQLYSNGQKRRSFDLKSFLGWAILGIYQSAIFYFFAVNLDTPDSRGLMPDLWTTGTIAYTLLICGTTAHIGTMTRSWTWINVGAACGSIVTYFLFVWLLSSAGYHPIGEFFNIQKDAYGVWQCCVMHGGVFVVLPIAVALAVAPSFAIMIYKVEFSNRLHWQELAMSVSEKIRTPPERDFPATMRGVEGDVKNFGYAFSEDKFSIKAHKNTTHFGFSESVPSIDCKRSLESTLLRTTTFTLFKPLENSIVEEQDSIRTSSLAEHAADPLCSLLSGIDGV